MKTVEFALVFSVSIHFAYTSSITLFLREAAAEPQNAADSQNNPLGPSDEEITALDSPDLGVEMMDARFCLPAECNAHCRRLGYARGVCIGNLCQCRLRTSPFADLGEDDEEEIEPRAQGRCTPNSCLQLCRRRGFRYSRCTNGRCYCWT